MALSEKWASPDDFATLFQYFWHRDFPINQTAIGARRADWTIHIGIVVRNIADIMGLWARFEHGSRKDAILKSGVGDEIAIEWEWKDTWYQELKKLEEHNVWTNPDNTEPGIKRLLKYGVLITYAPTTDITNVYAKVAESWGKAKWPLLLILIDYKKSNKFSSRRKFNDLQMSVFDGKTRKELRVAPAYPWEVSGTRMYVE